jgi:hypothetical protein
MGFALFIVVFVTVYIAFVEFTNIDINAFWGVIWLYVLKNQKLKKQDWKL